MNEQRCVHDGTSAELAWKRVRAFLEKYIG